MKLNEKGIELIKSYEGVELAPYKDSGGAWTIGYGHLIVAGENEKYKDGITIAAALELLKQDIKIAENAVNEQVTRSLTPNQFTALISLVFNIGVGGFKKSTLLKRLNDGTEKELRRVPGEILKWHWDNGKPVKGLVNRRAKEAVLFLS